MKRHAAIAIADTDVALTNWLIYELELALRDSTAVSVLDYGFENLFVEPEIAKQLITPITGLEIPKNDAQSIARYSKVGPEPCQDENAMLLIHNTLDPGKVLEERVKLAAMNIDHLGLTHLIVLGGHIGLEGTKTLKEKLKSKSGVKLYFVPMNMDGNMGYKLPGADIVPIHTVGYPSAAVDIHEQTIKFSKHAHNMTRALCMTVLGGGNGYVAAAGASGQGMMIIPEIRDIIETNFPDFLARAVHYLDQNKRLVVSVAEKSYLPHDEKYTTPVKVKLSGGTEVDIPLLSMIRAKQSGHGITEGNYLAEIMNRHFKGTRSRYTATDGDYNYMSRIAGGIDFDRQVARVYAKTVAQYISSNSPESGVVGVEFITPFGDLAKDVELYNIDDICVAQFPTKEGGFFDREGWTVTQKFKDLICSFAKARLPKNGR